MSSGRPMAMTIKNYLLGLLLLVLASASSSFQSAFLPLRATQSPLFVRGGESQTPASLISQEKKKAIIVGGGPVGLATALTLSNAPHFYDVTLLEESPKVTEYDPTKAYLYLVNPRGQVWTKRFPRVQELIVTRGSENVGLGNYLIVPGDPKEPMPGKVPVRNTTEPSYWIPRHTMVALMEEVILDQEKQRQNEGLHVGSIQLLSSQECRSLIPLDDGRVKVVVMDKNDPDVRFEHTFSGDLVVGADGMNSAVRNCLADDTSPKVSWLTMDSKKFQIRGWKSPASGLRIKVLQFPPNFEIPVEGEKPIKTENEVIYAIQSVNTGQYDFVRLGLLPVKDPNGIRPTNIITRPNHDVWKLKTGQEVKDFFLKAFPRLNMENIVSDEEWERFTAAKGTIFPQCQYSPGLQVSHPNGNTGVVLVGDAIHSFPPDIGQGINAGLGDVEALDRALKGKDLITGKDKKGKPSNLAEALAEYEKVRGPEIRALIRLARFGAPYQYSQSLLMDRVGKFLWTVNVGLKLFLNKISFGLIPPACFMGVMDKSLTYRKLMRQADVTSVVLWILGLLALWRVCWFLIFQLVGRAIPL